MDIINNYKGGTTGKREKEIINILKGKYPILEENKLVRLNFHAISDQKIDKTKYNLEN